MSEDNTMDALLDLFRRLPPTNVEKNLNILCDLAPEYEDDLVTSVDQPLKILHDESAGRDFLGCDYNRDGDSFRSPWTDTYIPPNPGAPHPSQRLRQLEIQLNAAFDTYRELYYEGGVGSVYLWDMDEDPGATKDMAFAGCVNMKKVLPQEAGTGSWDSLHVFECIERGRSAKYKLTSTVILVLDAKTKADAVDTAGQGRGDVKLSGSVTRQIEVDNPLPSATAHIPNIGRLIEDMEIKMRNLLSSVYFGKTKDVIGELRSQIGLEAKSKEDMLRAELAGKLGNRR